MSDETPVEEAPRAPLDAASRQLLVRTGMLVVERAAKHVARRFRRFVDPSDLRAVGTIEMLKAVQQFDPSFGVPFADYAFFRVRCAMIKAVGAELYQERIRRAVEMASDQYWAYVENHEFDATKHDENEARRRFRAIANGMLATTFLAGVEEAQKPTPESEAAEQEEYAIAIGALRAGLSELSDEDHRVLVTIYRETKSMQDVSKDLAIPYGTLKRRHGASIVRLRDRLRSEGVSRAPEARTVAGAGSVVDFRRPKGK